MSVEKSTFGGVTVVDRDGDRVTIEPVGDENSQVAIQGGGVVVADRLDIEELARYLTEWLEETPIPDGWYVVKWRNGDNGIHAARVYGGVPYHNYGHKLDPNEITRIRRIGDLTQEDIFTLKKEDM